MLTFISTNLATIMISGILLAIVLWIISDIVKNKKSGKSAGCGCGCSGCPSATICHKDPSAVDAR